MSEVVFHVNENVREETNTPISESSSLESTRSLSEDKGMLSGSNSSSPSHENEGNEIPLNGIKDEQTETPLQKEEKSVGKSEDFSDPKEENTIANARQRYSKDLLMSLRYAPVSCKWPICLDITFKKREGNFDLDKWLRTTQDNKRSSTSSNSSQGSNTSLNGPEKQTDLETKKSKDPRERIKQEEQDGIVLSPQRRSFGTGCRVLGQIASNITGNRPESPTSDRSTRESHREMPARRIGSGRLVRREDSDQIIPDRREIGRKDRDHDRETDQRRDHRDWRTKNDSRYARDDRYDRRRRFFDDDDRRHDRRDVRDRRYQDQRRSSHENEEEAPEWFTGGPSSQNECIELVGFEEEDHPKPKRDKKMRSKKDREGGSGGRNSQCDTPVIIEQEEPCEDKEPQEDPQLNYLQQVEEKFSPEHPVVVEPCRDQDTMQFNIDDYLADILNIGCEDLSESEGASRLKQFFKQRESPVLTKGSAPNSRRSSLDLCPQVSNLLGFSEPAIRIPSPNHSLDSSHFFAPISPANRGNQNSLVDMLQHGRPQNMQQPLMQNHSRLQPPSVKDLLIGGKGQSLEEIEAGLLKNQQMSPIQSKMMGVPPPPIPPSSRASMPPPSKAQMHMIQQPTSTNQMFSDFLSQVSAPQKSSISNRISNENFLTKLMNGKNVIGRQPAVPNNAPTESDVIAMLIKNSSMSGNMVPQSQMNGTSPNMTNLHLSNSLHPNVPAVPLSQPSPSRAHLAPPPNNPPQPNQDLMMKIFHKQQQQIQQQKQQMFQHHHDPIKQLVGGVNNLSLNSSVSHQSDHALREALLRTDVHTLLQRLINGQVGENHLIAQLTSGNLSGPVREVVATSLKLLHNHNHSSSTLLPPRTTLTPSPTQQAVIGGGITLGTTPVSLSPRVASPNPDASNMLAAPHVMPPARVSPLMFTGGTLPGGAPRRLLSHQELVVHTQSILQNALLKQELEKAREKHRKREAERTRSPNPAVCMSNGPSAIHSSSTNRIIQDGSPTKGGVKRQSPLAFTPTSVMRKMTAERDRVEKKVLCNLNSEGNLDSDKHRDGVPSMSSLKMPGVQHYQAPPPSLKPDNRRDMHRIPSPLLPNSMLGPKAQMVISGHTPGMMSMGPPPPQPPHAMCPPPMPPHQRHMAMQPNIPMGRSSQHNLNSIRAFQAQTTPSSAFPQQMRRSQGPSAMHCSPMGTGTPHIPPPRVPNAFNALSHLGMGSNNNNPIYKTGENSLHIPTMANNSTHRNSPVNLVNFFGRDVMAQVQAGSLPELPGGKVLSLEEVERLQQTQAVPN